MTDWTTRRITQEIRSLDRDLFCLKDSATGVRHIMRKSYRKETYELEGGDTLTVLKDHPTHIMSLTDNWSIGGRPADWGVLPILKRLRQIDGWNPDSQVNTWEAQAEKAAEDKKRDFANTNEAFLKDFRKQFAKTFSDVNTANMDKKKDPRRKQDLKGVK